MLYIKNNCTNPYFNLAAEEYYLNNFDEDIITLWRNEPSVIIGKNQNAYAELNLDYIRLNNIDVVRRLTGGGAVFHDLGNINFTFISNISQNDKDNKNDIDFEYFTQPVVSALRTLGINAELKGRNDLLIDDCKISGNAQCNYKVYNKTDNNFTEKKLHHGTLLFDVDMTDLTGTLNADPEKIKSKNIKSVKSRVTNISSHLKNKLTVEEFFYFLEDYLIKINKNCTKKTLDAKDTTEIEKLMYQKYKNDLYTFGNNIKYAFKNKKYFSFGIIEVQFNVNDNIISDLKISGDFFGSSDISELEQKINGTIHNYDELKKAVESFENVNKFITNAKSQDILNMFF